MVKDLTLKKAQLKKKLDLKIAELEKERNGTKAKKEPIPERHMEAIKELIKIQAAKGNKKVSVHQYITVYRKKYELPRKKFENFPCKIFKQVFEDNYKEKPPKPSPTPSPEKSPEAGAKAGAKV